MTPPTPGTVTIHPLHGIPEVTAGADLGRMLRDALGRAGLSLREGDVLAVSSKVISKAQGLREPPQDRSEVVLRASRRVVVERATPTGTTRIVEAVAGPVMAGAGVDGSNTGPDGRLLVLPPDPDLAARDLYAAMLTAYAPEPLPRIGIVVTDTAGRAWRAGQTDFALGACAVAVADDLRGGPDADGRDLAVTTRAVADEIAAAADLVKGKVAGVPAALLRGLPQGTVVDPGAPGARSMVRSGPEDWFALGTAEAVRSALGVPPGSDAAAAVGLPSAGTEEYADRLARAVRLALHGHTGGDIEEAGPGHLIVRADDPYIAGRLGARLEVALASENLTGVTVTRGAGR